MTTKTNKKTLYSTLEAAKIFNVTDRTVRRWLAEEDSRFPNAQRISGSGQYVIPWDDIQQALENYQPGKHRAKNRS